MYVQSKNQTDRKRNHNDSDQRQGVREKRETLVKGYKLPVRR